MTNNDDDTMTYEEFLEFCSLFKYLPICVG